MKDLYIGLNLPSLHLSKSNFIYLYLAIFDLKLFSNKTLSTVSLKAVVTMTPVLYVVAMFQTFMAMINSGISKHALCVCFIS